MRAPKGAGWMFGLMGLGYSMRGTPCIRQRRGRAAGLLARNPPPCFAGRLPKREDEECRGAACRALLASIAAPYSDQKGRRREEGAEGKRAQKGRGRRREEGAEGKRAQKGRGRRREEGAEGKRAQKGRGRRREEGAEGKRAQKGRGRRREEGAASSAPTVAPFPNPLPPPVSPQ